MTRITQLPGGVYPPLPTFFDDAGEVDLAALATHLRQLMPQPLAGFLVLGSNGEAMHLTDAERVQVIATARTTLDAAGTPRHQVLLAGTADQSTRGTIARTQAAAAAGAEVAVVLPPFAFPTHMSPAALTAHFTAVADASPIPIILYNMPANAANIDLSAELVIALAAHPNIIGMKDSSGQITKLARIVAATPAAFAVLAGSGGFFLPTLSVGGSGTIAAVANVVPALVGRLYQYWAARATSADLAGDLALAQTLQARIIPLNQLVTTTYGVAGLKAALQIAYGWGGIPRPPLLPLNDAQVREIEAVYAALITAP
jgi:4-hydroxy-2-oxoglutarate aldolase